MAFDVYGERLTPGHCEVHPYVAEEYPCSLCIDAARAASASRRVASQRLEDEIRVATCLAHIENSDEQSDPGVI